MATTANPQRRHVHLRQLLQNPETFATTLLAIVIDVYGTTAFRWAPETLRLELEQDFQLRLPPANVDKLLAAVLVLTTDQFHKNLPTFIHVCNILSGDDFNPEVFDPADSFEMAWGITEALLLDPPEEDEPFSDEIRHYMAHMLREEGIVDPPDVLRIAVSDGPRDYASLFDDDAAAYEEFSRQHQARSQEITAMLRERLQELLDELAALPLVSGDTKGLLDKLRSKAT